MYNIIHGSVQLQFLPQQVYIQSQKKKDRVQLRWPELSRLEFSEVNKISYAWEKSQGYGGKREQKQILLHNSTNVQYNGERFRKQGTTALHSNLFNLLLQNMIVISWERLDRFSGLHFITAVYQKQLVSLCHSHQGGQASLHSSPRFVDFLLVFSCALWK